MCFGGGGGGGATITMPDTAAYDRQFELQKTAIEQSMNNSNNLLQSKLQDSLRQQQMVLDQSKTAKQQLAESTQAQAMRMAQLIGTPPPEKTAQAPVVAGNRTSGGVQGKRALRIELATANAQGQGAGLNIT